MNHLLAPDEPAPLRVLRPNGASDFVLAADHAGRLIPRALGDLGLDEVERSRHIAWDIGIAGVTETLSGVLDAAAVLQAYSRLVIDCNRALHHPTSIPRVSELTAIPGNESLSPEDRTSLNEHLELARKLGAEVNCLHGDDFVQTILDFACEQRVTQLFLGHTGTDSGPRWWSPSAIDRLIEAAETFDIRLFPHAEDK